jgi:DNA end-binding protein Ku
MAAKTTTKAQTRAAKPKKKAERSPTSNRAIWKGAITFGLITIPVGLFAAVEERSIAFHQLHATDLARIRYQRVCSKEGKEVPYDEIVKGYEYEKDRYVVFTDEELERLPVDSLRTIDVEAFVDPDQVDPLSVEGGYYLAPEKSAVKAYRLLAEAMEKAGRTGVARITLRQKEHLAMLRARDGVIILETLHWPDEIREPRFKELEAEPEIRPQEVEMARRLIEELADDFHPEAFHDTYRERLEEIIAAKIEGKEVTLAPEAKETPEVADLMEALRASVEAAKSRPKTKSA